MTVFGNSSSSSNNNNDYNNSLSPSLCKIRCGFNRQGALNGYIRHTRSLRDPIGGWGIYSTARGRFSEIDYRMFLRLGRYSLNFYCDRFTFYFHCGYHVRMCVCVLAYTRIVIYVLSKRCPSGKTWAWDLSAAGL